MISADLHSHTRISHGENSVAEMYRAAASKGLRHFGFSEHSPLPAGFNCALYTGDLVGEFGLYADDVLELKRTAKGAPVALLALELDWIPSRHAWMRSLVDSQPFDYVLGSLHFLDGWSVGNPGNWGSEMGLDEKFGRFCAYFCEMTAMAKSGLAQIAAHPDFIKLRVWPDFQKWLAAPGSRDYIAGALEALKAGGMAMEVSSAGLRWPFAEPYPGPVIMRLARDIGVPIAFGADAHRAGDIAAEFDFLADYARSFGYAKSVIFIDKQPRMIEF